MSTTCEDTKKYMNQEISHDNMRLTTYIESKQLKTERAKKFPLCVLTTTMPTRSGRDYTIPKSPESPKDGKNPIPPLRGTQCQEGPSSDSEIEHIESLENEDAKQLLSTGGFVSAVSSSTHHLATPSVCRTLYPPISSVDPEEKGDGQFCPATIPLKLDKPKRRSQGQEPPQIPQDDSDESFEVDERDVESGSDEDLDMKQLFKQFLKFASMNSGAKAKARVPSLKREEHRPEPVQVKHEARQRPRATEDNRAERHTGQVTPILTRVPDWNFGWNQGLIAPAPMTMPMPSLLNKLDIKDHLESLDDILGEMGYLAEGDFRPEMRSLVRNLVIDSFKNQPEVQRFATGPGKRQLSWKQLQEILISEFASLHQIKAEMDQKLKALTFKRPVSAFISTVREIYHLHRQFYVTDNDSVRRLVDRIVELIPPSAATALVTNMYNVNPDWQVAYPFAEGKGQTFLALLEKRLASQEVVEQFHRPSSRQPQVPSINMVKETKKPWLADWCRQFKGVLRCQGSGHREEIEKLVAVDKSIDAKLFRRGKTGPYALVGFRSAPPSLNCQSRPFALKEDGQRDDGAKSKNM